ncbi:SLC5 family protein [Altererythrobacter rubellus]|jgi:SSS family solute:Na+ symporter|uniref:SLC5 family protein n=1 Tax=Altererythrobacter rubellus TaxID=2173831 RepID=A0A9Y2B6K8_9SPHN|nr:SLC5 family protein [Altererythrobacter rubellus]WIW96394.1 SLC5 family protein [Altererythrobacter rubellus]
MANPIQVAVFLGITALIAFATFVHCRGKRGTGTGDERDYFLANGGLAWYFVAGSITLTNLSTDQLVSMNGNQMLLIVWWELAAVVGLFILAFVFLPVYYKNNCTTTTELLQKKYGDKHIRALISLLFLAGNLFIFLPAILYGGSRFFLSLLGYDGGIENIMLVSVVLAIVGAAYAVFGGLRAVAVSDTYSGVLILSLALVVVYLALQAINFDFSGIPADRLTLIGDSDSDIPWTTLLTGMIFIQTFYWSTNQTITQRAMASPTVKEAQKGVLAAAAIRLLIVPLIVVVPGIVAYKLFGDVPSDGAYGMIVAEVLPTWLSGAFAAALFAAALTTFNSILNASAALYVCDMHEAYIDKPRKVGRLGAIVSIIMSLLALTLVPFFASQESLINTVQQLYGLLSMPILSAFIVGLLFTNVQAAAAMIGVVSGVVFYGFWSMVWEPAHYIHGMAVTLLLSVFVSLLVNRVLFGQSAQPVWSSAKA